MRPSRQPVPGTTPIPSSRKCVVAAADPASTRRWSGADVALQRLVIPGYGFAATTKVTAAGHGEARLQLYEEQQFRPAEPTRRRGADKYLGRRRSPFVDHTRGVATRATWYCAAVRCTASRVCSIASAEPTSGMPHACALPRATPSRRSDHIAENEVSGEAGQTAAYMRQMRGRFVAVRSVGQLSTSG